MFRFTSERKFKKALDDGELKGATKLVLSFNKKMYPDGREFNTTLRDMPKLKELEVSNILGTKKKNWLEIDLENLKTLAVVDSSKLRGIVYTEDSKTRLKKIKVAKVPNLRLTLNQEVYENLEEAVVVEAWNVSFLEDMKSLKHLKIVYTPIRGNFPNLSKNKLRKPKVELVGTNVDMVYRNLPKEYVKKIEDPDTNEELNTVKEAISRGAGFFSDVLGGLSKWADPETEEKEKEKEKKKRFSIIRKKKVNTRGHIYLSDSSDSSSSSEEE